MHGAAVMMINGRKALVRKLALGERGGAAILMLVAFMVMAVPLSISAVQTAGQLSRHPLDIFKKLLAPKTSASA